MHHADAVARQPKRISRHRRHLGVQTLPHLGAAMIDLRRAVGVDDDQSPRLVEHRDGKGDPKLDRLEGEPAFDVRATSVEGVDLRATRPIIARRQQLLMDALEPDLLNLLSVRGPVAPALGVVVTRSDFRRVSPRLLGEASDRLLDDDHTLRATKATKGGA